MVHLWEILRRAAAAVSLSVARLLAWLGLDATRCNPRRETQLLRVSRTKGPLGRRGNALPPARSLARSLGRVQCDPSGRKTELSTHCLLRSTLWLVLVGSGQPCLATSFRVLQWRLRRSATGRHRCRRRRCTRRLALVGSACVSPRPARGCCTAAASEGLWSPGRNSRRESEWNAWRRRIGLVGCGKSGFPATGSASLDRRPLHGALASTKGVVGLQGHLNA